MHKQKEQKIIKDITLDDLSMTELQLKWKLTVRIDWKIYTKRMVVLEIVLKISGR